MELRPQLRWVNYFRVVFLSVIVTSGMVANLAYDQEFSAPLLRWVVAGLFFSGVVFLILRKTLAKIKLEAIAWVQVVWDVCFASAVVYYSGGSYSAFVLIYAIHILTGAVMLRAKGAIVSALFGLIGYGSVILLRWREFDSEPTSVSRLLFTVSMLLFLGGIVAYIMRNRERLESSLQKTSVDLQNLSELHRVIVDHIASGVLYVNANDRVIFVNPAAKEILGSDPTGSAVRGTELEGLLEEQRRAETNLHLEGGRTIIIGHQATRLPNRDWVILFQDLSLVRSLEHRIRLKEKMASVGQLAAGMAHEIRNPLASLSGSIQVLKSEVETDPTSKKLMDIVVRETDRLDHLVNSFLNYARPTGIEADKVKVRNLIEEIVNLVEASRRTGSKGYSFLVDVDPGLFCHCDGQKLRQILWNLIQNAIQSVDDGGEIRISAESNRAGERSCVRFEVQDNGIGMDDETRARIFDPFFTTRDGGTGLGLALVYEMVQAHEGDVGVESTKGEGTTIWFELPNQENEQTSAA